MREDDAAQASTPGPENGSPAGVAVALRRVAVGYRLVGALWLTALALLAITGPGSARPADRPVLVVAVVVAVWTWTAATGLLAAVGSPSLRSWWWLAADVAVAGATIVAPVLAGTEAFAGGYPFSAVLLAAYTRGALGALVAGACLAALSLSGLGGDVAELAGVVGLVLFYLAGGAVSAWGIGVIRRHEQARLAIEATLAEERTQRIRSQERAETAAHLHDSVLQTLALIQRRAHDPAEVTSLARRQERDLRAWLYAPAGRGDRTSLAAALREVAAEVEETHGVRVEVVTVGDARPVEGAEALVGAAREALVNAAKHAGTDEVDLYAEIGITDAAVYVRDRGRGFDPATVPADRRGLRDSIHGRLRHHGGAARVAASPGRGTEVELRLPLDGPPPHEDARIDP